MWVYILKRVLVSIPLIIGLATVTFFIIHLAPGDPMALYRNPDISPEVMELMRKNLGLDQPLHIQYVRWLTSMARGNFGVSFTAHRPVLDILKEAIPNTLQLTFLALVLDLIVGIVIGVISAIKQYTAVDHSITVSALFIYSMPSFWLGLMLILLFSLVLGWLPASQMQSINADLFGFWHQLWDRITHLIMPVFVLGIATAAGTARFMRGSLLEVIRQDYIRTARAKGLSERVVVFRHGLRNALIPIVTLTGLYLPFLLGGSVITETIFAWPGMGRVAVGAIFARDYPVVLAVNLIAAVMVVLGNLLADITYSVLDPRIRLD
jgi:peptide/nickel transport system permease protein